MSLAALAALVPASLLPYRRRLKGTEPVFWMVLAVALAGPTAVAVIDLRGSWNTGFSTAIWLSISASVALFILLAAIVREAWRLAPLVLPYLLLLGVLATIWTHAPSPVTAGAPFDSWLKIHIASSLATYALVTLAAVAAAAVFLQERALKRKHAGGLAQLLPPLADSERLEVVLLRLSTIVLAVGLLSGMAVQYLTTKQLIVLDHKVLFSFLAFAVLLLLLAFHQMTGLRGRLAVRLALLAYLLLTIAYPGVKFVADVLIT